MNEWIDAETHVERAQHLYEKGQWVEAAAELRAAIDLNPANASWHFNLGLTLEAMDQLERACGCYRAALRLQPNDVEVLNCLGVNMTRQGRYAEALEHLEKAGRINPDFEPSYCNRIVAYAEIGEHDKAELMFYLARQVKEDCPVCYYNIGNSFYTRRMFAKAIACWEKAIKLDPAHRRVNARLADALWRQGDLPRARKHYLAELEIEPRDVDVLLDLAELLMEMGLLDEAGEKLRKALEIEPGHADAHFFMGDLALRRGQLVRAEEQFRLVLRIDRQYSGAHARLAKVLMVTSRHRHAVKHLLAELNRCQGDPSMLQELGQLFIEANQNARANDVLRLLVKVSPQDAFAQHNLAVSYFMMDKMEDGIRHCRRAIKLKPSYALALYNLALAHLHRGQVSRARRYAAKALTLSPTDQQVLQLNRQLAEPSIWSTIRSRLFWRRGR